MCHYLCFGSTALLIAKILTTYVLVLLVFGLVKYFLKSNFTDILHFLNEIVSLAMVY